MCTMARARANTHTLASTQRCSRAARDGGSEHAGVHWPDTAMEDQPINSRSVALARFKSHSSQRFQRVINSSPGGRVETQPRVCGS